jgi:membrane fusion protein, copper/silver efflux system
MLNQSRLLLFLILFSLLLIGCAEKNQKKILYYANPMDPSIKSDKPIKDPMGMDYIPIYDESSDNTGDNKEKYKLIGLTEIKISAEKQQLIGVKTDLVAKQDLIKNIRTIGIISHDSDLYNTVQEYLSAVSYYEQIKNTTSAEVINSAKLLVSSAEFKLKIAGFSQTQINNIINNRQLDSSLLISDNSRTSWVEIEIYENDLDYIKPGLDVTITVPSLPGKQFTGKIITIDSILNIETRTLKARVLINNASLNLKHEIYVNADIQIPVGRELSIPADAVIDSGTRQIAFVAKENGFFEPREIIIGRQIGNFYPLYSGIQEGEKVVTSANFLIDSESQLKAALKQMK